MQKDIYADLETGKNNQGLTEKKEREFTKEQDDIKKEINANIRIIRETADKLFQQNKLEQAVKITAALAGADTKYAIEKAKDLYRGEKKDLAAVIVAELIKYDREAVKDMISQCVLKGPIETDTAIAIAEKDSNPDWVEHIRQRCVDHNRPDLVEKIDRECYGEPEEAPEAQKKFAGEFKIAEEEIARLIDKDKFKEAAELASDTGDARFMNIFGEIVSGLRDTEEEEQAAEIASIMGRFYGNS